MEASLVAHAAEAEGRTSNLLAGHVARLPTPPHPLPPSPARARHTPRGRRAEGVRTPLPAAPPPLTPPLGADRLGHTGHPPRERATGGQAGGRGDRAIPPTLNRRSTGPTQEARRGTNRPERPYRRPARVPLAVRASSRQGGESAHITGRERTQMQRARSANLNGNWTGPAKRRDCVEWRTSRRRKGTLGQDNPQHAPRGARGKGEAKGGGIGGPTPALPPPDLPQAPHIHEQGTAAARTVVAQIATHQPRG